MRLGCFFCGKIEQEISMRNKSFLKTKLDDYKAIVKKWIRDNEELDYDSSSYSEGYFILRIKENKEFVLVPGNTKKGRIVFAKETAAGIKYLYDSVQLYNDWDIEKKDFSKLSALDTNIYIHLIISITDDLTAGAGIMLGLAEDAKDAICRYLSLNPEAKGDDTLGVMRKCASFFQYPYFCYTTFYLGYKKLNMAHEAGIAHEMMGKTFDLREIKNDK